MTTASVNTASGRRGTARDARGTRPPLCYMLVIAVFDHIKVAVMIASVC